MLRLTGDTEISLDLVEYWCSRLREGAPPAGRLRKKSPRYVPVPRHCPSNSDRAKEGLQPHVPATRTCLRCGRQFSSGWVGNRLCDHCHANHEAPHPTW